MKILGLAGSPRKKGNTDLLLDAFLEGAAEGGGEIEKVRLAKLEIHPCIGCEKCSKKGVCRFKDDAVLLYEKVIEADLLVLASPVYFYNVTSQMKLFLDRCQALWARKFVLNQSLGTGEGRGVLISTGGTKGGNLFEGITLTAKYFIKSIDKQLAACLTYTQVDEKGAIKSHPTALAEAKALGRKMAEDATLLPMEGCDNG
jgi:multimeric flavodoxin WrbA